MRDFAGLVHANDYTIIAFQHHDRQGDRERTQPVGHLALEDSATEKQITDGVVGQDNWLFAVPIHTLNHHPQRRAQIFQVVVLLSLARAVIGDQNNTVTESRRRNKQHSGAGRNRREPRPKR